MVSYIEKFAGWDWESEQEQALAVYYKHYDVLKREPNLVNIMIHPAYPHIVLESKKASLYRPALPQMAIILWVYPMAQEFAIPSWRRVPSTQSTVKSEG